jgi:hypothetical protein
VEEMDKRLSFLGDLKKRQIIESVRYTEEFGLDGGEPGILRPWNVGSPKPPVDERYNNDLCSSYLKNPFRTSKIT